MPRAILITGTAALCLCSCTISRVTTHFIIRELGSIEGEINVIPQSTKRFISFSKKVGGIEIRFDSLRFMPSSLSKLADNLPKNLFNCTRQYYEDEEFNLLTAKGVYPYDYISSYDKLNEVCLPPASAFYNYPTESALSDEDYKHAQKVWRLLKIQNLGHYTDVYLKTDVLILADIFENFRDLCMETYKLDPAWYYSAPSLAWSAMLKCTKISLELLSDYDLFLMIENGKRGGLCQCIQRHAEANNHYMENYDSSRKSKYISYLDANNLYGFAMNELLPTGHFEWIGNDEINQISLLNIPDDAAWGYFLEVDIDYPESLHDAHSDLPFCPEAKVVPGSMYCKLTTLHSKKNYVAH